MLGAATSACAGTWRTGPGNALLPPTRPRAGEPGTNRARHRQLLGETIGTLELGDAAPLPELYNAYVSR